MIYLGADHGGFELKEHVKMFLKEHNYKFMDLGNLSFDSADDYPDFAFSVAERVAKEDNPKKKWENRAKGILFCRSSEGMVIAANKVKGIRAVSAFDAKSAKKARLDNDSNILALAGDWVKEKEAYEIVKAWLSTEFSKEERHARRIRKITDYEKLR